MTRKALVVDDDVTMVKTLSDLFRLQGWEVSTANSGTDAVAAAAAAEFDVVLMDFRMPGMDGVAAFKAIKTVRPDVKVVLMSAYLANEVVEEAEREGIMRVMSKPVNIADLFSLLSRRLSPEQTILVVDSDPIFLNSFAEVLALRGFNAVAVENVEQAVDAISKRSPVAVLLHLHLADKQARDVVARIREASPKAPVLVYSGHPDARDDGEAALPREWIHAYLRKPFAVEQITGVLDGIGAG
jgi:DNA-binding NtrC family response regulator